MSALGQFAVGANICSRTQIILMNIHSRDTGFRAHVVFNPELTSLNQQEESCCPVGVPSTKAYRSQMPTTPLQVPCPTGADLHLLDVVRGAAACDTLRPSAVSPHSEFLGSIGLR